MVQTNEYGHLRQCGCPGGWEGAPPGGVCDSWCPRARADGGGGVGHPRSSGGSTEAPGQRRSQAGVAGGRTERGRPQALSPGGSDLRFRHCPLKKIKSPCWTLETRFSNGALPVLSFRLPQKRPLEPPASMSSRVSVTRRQRLPPRQLRPLGRIVVFLLFFKSCS